MKFVSWNVNGLRACLKKDFMQSFKLVNADIFAVQETKMQPEQAIIELNNYKQFWNSADKKGYSGTAIFTRLNPINTTYGIGIDEHDHEGRVITLEFDSFFFVNVYTPNSRHQLERLDYRMMWDDAFRNYVSNLDKQKPVIICGDLNAAHNEIDLKNNRGIYYPLYENNNQKYLAEKYYPGSDTKDEPYFELFSKIYNHFKDKPKDYLIYNENNIYLIFLQYFI